MELCKVYEKLKFFCIFSDTGVVYRRLRTIRQVPFRKRKLLNSAGLLLPTSHKLNLDDYNEPQNLDR